MSNPDRCRLTANSQGMISYRYAIGGGTSFHFHCLSEVGEPFIPWFKEEIARRGWTVEHGRNLEAKPWVADFVTRRPKPHAQQEV